MLKDFLQPHPHMPGVEADIIGHIGNWPISNSTVFLLFTVFCFIVLFFVVRKFKLVPNFFQSLFEILFEKIENLLKSLSGGKDHRAAELLFPISALFLIVGFINIVGSFPIINQITWLEGEHVVPLFRKATSDINTTIGLALAIVLSVQFFGIKNWGFFGYFSRFLPLGHLVKSVRGGVGSFFMALIELFVGLLELVSEFVKIISLSLRLFGNMFAGEILLAILTGAFAYVVPALWLGFDLMVAVIQTLVIGCLASVYYLLVVKEEGQKGGH